MATGLGSTTSPTPQTRDFATLKRDVASYVKMPDLGEALDAAGAGLNDAIRRLNTRAWNWSLTSTDIGLSAGTAEYSLPSDFKDVRAMELLDGSGDSKRKLGYMHYKDFLDRYPNPTASNSPQVATVLNANNSLVIALNYEPSSTFVSNYPTLRVRYFQRVPVLTEDNDRPEVFSEVENYMTWSAKEYIASVFDPSKIGYAARMASLEWQRLISDDTETGYRDWTEEFYR